MDEGALFLAKDKESLQRIWEKSQGGDYDNDMWLSDTRVLYNLGAGLGETLEFLYHQKPSFIDFLTWLQQFAKATNNYTNEDVLSPEDLEFWNTNGYVVVKEAVPLQQCIDAQQAIWNFLGASMHDRKSWYQPHPQKQGLMLLFTQDQTLEANRNSERIRNAYRQLYGTDRIYKTVDKISFNPPETTSFKFRGSSLHWDVSLALPIPFQLQGLLYLTDVAANGGAFHCVPGFHRIIDDWLFNIPDFSDAREIARQTLKPEPVAANAGDFIIWHQALPHCATPNTSDFPRMVQYLTYLPEESKSQQVWI
jgi:hypothetical protein